MGVVAAIAGCVTPPAAVGIEVSDVVMTGHDQRETRFRIARPAGGFLIVATTHVD